MNSEKNSQKKSDRGYYDKMFINYPDVMEVKHVMSALHICRSGVYALLKSGKLHYFTIGRVYKIPKVSLCNYVNQTKTE